MSLERSINKSDKTGWIEVICGSMFSGKTEELIRRIKRDIISLSIKDTGKMVRDMVMEQHIFRTVLNGLVSG